MRILILLTLSLLSSSLFGQVSIGLKSNRNHYLSYEPIYATVTIANQAGQPLTLKNANGTQWIEFVVRNQNGRVIQKVKHNSYAGTTIPTAESIKSSFILNNTYDLAQPGNYSVYAVVRTPNQSSSQGTRSPATYFTVSRGVASWRTKVGVPGVAGDEREYRILNHRGGKAARIYVQVQDVRRGHILATYSMGNTLEFRKSLKAIDRQNNLHVLFLTTPELYCHTVVNTSGKTIKRIYYKALKGTTTHPALFTHNDGSVHVTNAELFDPEKEREERNRFHKISEEPQF